MPIPIPVPAPVPRLTPKPMSAPKPRPIPKPKAGPKPTPKPLPAPVRKPTRKVTAAPTPKPALKPAPAAKPVTRPSPASRSCSRMVAPYGAHSSSGDGNTLPAALLVPGRRACARAQQPWQNAMLRVCGRGSPRRTCLQVADTSTQCCLKVRRAVRRHLRLRGLGLCRRPNPGQLLRVGHRRVNIRLPRHQRAVLLPMCAGQSRHPDAKARTKASAALSLSQ